MRHNPSTVVVLAGPSQWQQHSDGLLAAISRFMNVSLVRPAAGENGGVEDAAATLRRAAGIFSPYVLVAADPLAAVAAEWEAMWDISGKHRDSEEFELRAAEALASWRARQFELPDYYLVLARARQGRERQGAGQQAEAQGPVADFYLGPLRALRPHRVAVVAASEPAEQAAGVLTALGSLRHGRWWPALDEVINAARRFYPGSLADAPDGSPVPLLS